MLPSLEKLCQRDFSLPSLFSSSLLCSDFVLTNLSLTLYPNISMIIHSFEHEQCPFYLLPFLWKLYRSFLPFSSWFWSYLSLPNALFYSLNLLRIIAHTNRTILYSHVLHASQTSLIGLSVYFYDGFAESSVRSATAIICMDTLFYMWLLIDMFDGRSGLSYDPWIQQHDLHAYTVAWESMVPP